MKDLTIVTGFWNIRKDRSEDLYLKNFENLLSLQQNMVIFVPKKYENFVLEKRKNLLDKTKVIIVELEDIKNFYFKDYWDKLQNIRSNPNWYNRMDWLKNAPQCFSEWYNPVVMSKVFFIEEACKQNFFNTEKFVWIDAGITQHISKNLITDSKLEKIINYINKVFFTSISYESWEIHGFIYDGYKKYVDFIPNWLCRATIFGCDIKFINKFVKDYRYYLDDTLDGGYLGTEESIFTLLTCIDETVYHRYHMGNVAMPDKFLKDIE